MYKEAFAKFNRIKGESDSMSKLLTLSFDKPKVDWQSDSYTVHTKTLETTCHT